MKVKVVRTSDYGEEHITSQSVSTIEDILALIKETGCPVIVHHRRKYVLGKARGKEVFLEIYDDYRE